MAVSEQQIRQRDSRPRKALTIGAVCKILQNEFDDIRSRRSATSRTRSC